MNSSQVVGIIAVIVVIAGIGAFFYLSSSPKVSPSFTSSTTTSVTTSSQPVSSSSTPTNTSQVTLTSTNSSSSSSTTSITSVSQSLPPGATPLPYNMQNNTVDIVLVVTQNNYNFNGSTNGKMKIYVPAGSNLELTLINNAPAGTQHNLLLVQNNTATPTSVDISQNGKILLYVGTTPSSYEFAGLQPGMSATGTYKGISAGYYWLACGMGGHAADFGMWVDLIASSNVTVPYVING